MIKAAKRGVLRAARALGVFRLAAESEWRRRRLLVLCYHGVALRDEHIWNPMLYVSQELLRERFRTLRDSGANVLSLAEGLRRLANGTLPPRAVAITFDDGTHDFAARALPVLEEFGYPVTIYVSSFYCGFQRPIFDPACSYLMWRGRGKVVAAHGLLPGRDQLDLRTDESIHECAVAMYVYARDARLSATDKDAYLARLGERVGVPYETLTTDRVLHAMTSDEVAALPPWVDVQMHTHRHRTPLDRTLFVREIDDNRSAISAMRRDATPLVHFCYPSGFHRPEFLPWLRELGVESATTCVNGFVSPDDDPLVMSRFIDTSNVSPIEFSAWLAGVGAWLPRRREEPGIAHVVALASRQPVPDGGTATIERPAPPRPARPQPGPARARPTIGVVIPCYNGAQYVADAIASVRCQTLQPDRIVLVDDASTDNSVVLATSLGVECIRQPQNAGPSAARNRALQALDTELVAFVDVDDRWQPDHLASLVELLDGWPSVPVAFSDVTRSDGSESPHRRLLPPGVPVDLSQLLLFDSPVPQSGVVARRAVLASTGGYDESLRRSEDYDLWLRMSFQHDFVYSGRRTCNYMVHASQVSQERPKMIRASWRARLKVLGTAPATSGPRQIESDLLRDAWEHSLWGCSYLGDRSVAQDVLALHGRIPGTAWRALRWWYRINVIWWPWQAARRIWAEVPPATRERFHLFDERRRASQPAPPAARPAGVSAGG